MILGPVAQLADVDDVCIDSMSISLMVFETVTVVIILTVLSTNNGQ